MSDPRGRVLLMEWMLRRAFHSGDIQGPGGDVDHEEPIEPILALTRIEIPRAAFFDGSDGSFWARQAAGMGLAARAQGSAETLALEGPYDPEASVYTFCRADISIRCAAVGPKGERCALDKERHDEHADLAGATWPAARVPVPIAGGGQWHARDQSKRRWR